MLGLGISYRLYCLLILAGLVGCVFYGPVAMADDIDPFQINSGHWMPFDRYSDNIKRNRPVGGEAITQAPAKVEVPELPVPAAEGDKPSEVSQAPSLSTIEPISFEPVVAAPTRPLDLPVMPGVNNGFSVQVDSTADSNNAAPPAKIISTNDGASDMHLQEQNWQDAAELARQHANVKNGVSNDSDHSPLNVRMSFLPNTKITPAPSPERKPRLRMVDVPAPPKPAPEPVAKPAECAAIDLYKKKQLEAIQSDRQTLEALQSAINDLGLQGQLNFMNSARQSPVLGVSSQNQPVNVPSPIGTP